jgi:peptidoglycan/xylan/chitin deacetylase (PgdA/CDA1 family)
MRATTCTILTYHMIDTPISAVEAKYCCTPAQFAAQMQHLQDSGYNVVSLGRAVDAIAGGRALPPCSVAITIDDGLECAFRNALPILEKFGYPATLYAISGLIGDTNRWVQSEGYPLRRMVTRDELRQMSSSCIEIGSHTVTHPRLAKLPIDKVHRELRQSKQTLEDLLGRPVVHLAYPYGSFSREVRDAAQAAGYRSASSTVHGRCRLGDDRFLVKRVEIVNRDDRWRFAVKLRLAMSPAQLARKLAKSALEGMRLRQPAYGE